MSRRGLAVAAAFLPQSAKLFVLRHFLGYRIDRTARIGFSLVMPGQLVMGPGARIGHLNVMKGVASVSLGSRATIGNLNWITGYPVSAEARHFHDQDRRPSLVLGDHAALTNRHLVDCTDAVKLGTFATFGGFRSQVLTHSIDVSESRQRCQPVSIGAYTFIGTGCILLPGSHLPAHSMLAAGSVLAGMLRDENWLYAGNPARPVKQLDSDSAYFHRTIGFVE